MRFVIALWMLFGAGCVLQNSSPPPEPVTVPSEWETVLNGLERRTYIPEDNPLGQLIVLRVNPALYTFRAHYQPGQAHTLAEWQAQFPDAAAFINANFFSADHNILGLLVADGVAFGQSYQDRGGTFLVQNGIPRVRSNLTEPYAGEALQQAVQAFPMLVQDGAAAYTSGQPDRQTRRTVIAQDSAGNILLMVTPLLGLRLSELSAYLPTTDLNIVNAFNLDGGGSTMMYDQTPFQLSSFDPVPAILAVYAQ